MQSCKTVFAFCTCQTNFDDLTLVHNPMSDLGVKRRETPGFLFRDIGKYRGPYRLQDGKSLVHRYNPHILSNRVVPGEILQNLQFFLVKNGIRTYYLLRKRQRCQHSTINTQLTKITFKLILINAFVIYQILQNSTECIFVRKKLKDH